LFFKAFVLLRGMRWRRQIIGVGEKIGGNFAAAKEPLQLAAWGKIFLCVGACGFRREGSSPFFRIGYVRKSDVVSGFFFV